jgi:hypothetical protein
MTTKNDNEFENFDRTMRKLMKVSHDEIKAKLEKERVARDKQKPKALKKNLEKQTK